MGTRRSVQLKQSLQEGRNPSLRGLCEGRENRGSATIGEAPESVRGLTMVQYSSRVNGKGYGKWLKAWTGRRRTLDVKLTLKEKQNQTFRGVSVLAMQPRQSAEARRDVWDSERGPNKIQYVLKQN